ncbi:helicase C-terminal domain-containing protein [Nakamurella endophytica]|uniref:XPB/Ssl2-like helicase family protein n=1 Tax=Nakamurella endophytica TaxID=1748367 RepID=A0A917SN87_9ACTN|nr:helicase C-terminal domain-containing protein [Nakamurella endophytica]GGL89003.1 hypothetical protein GCM10011594_05820 [Nakamurella endophytica]
MASTLDWLRGRTDDALVALLRARPDLAVPAPSDLSVLARRLDSPPSVWRAMETLHRFRLQVLQAVLLLGGRDGSGTTADAVAAFVGAPATTDDVRSVLTGLETLGLVRGDDPARLSPAVAAALGEFPAGLGPPGRLSPAEVSTALAAATPEQRALLERLSHGQPRGQVGASGPAAARAAELVDTGLLLRGDSGTVLLPREVCLELRGAAPLGEVHVDVPPAAPTTPGAATVDGTAAGQALAALAATRAVLQALGRAPAPVLRSGGLGVRELRRIARTVDQDESQVALELELLAGAGLIAASEPRSREPASWTPTGEADDFLDAEDEQVWASLGATWLALRRDPDRIGARDLSDKVVAALSAEVSWLRGPADRRFVLGVLAALPPGQGLSPDDLVTRVEWLAPLRAADRRAALVRSVVAQATFLGLAAFDALAATGRALLDVDQDDAGATGALASPGAVAAAAEALHRALPEPVDTVLVQADMTVVAPGRLVPTLAARLEQVADVESAGSATVYRVTPDSLRRALDAGIPAGEIQALFGQHSATGVPQALAYLIDDVARRHGVLRVGAASSYLRSEDTALVDTAVARVESAGLPVRRLAPTVAMSPARPEDLLEVLRGAGLVPAAEDVSGGLVDLAPAPYRTRAAPGTPLSARREPAPPSVDQLAALVQRMRGADAAMALGRAAEQSSGEALQLLRRAADHRDAVWIGYVDSEGGTSRRVIEPIAVSGGTVAAFDRLRQSMRTFALHRISDVQPVVDGGE